MSLPRTVFLSVVLMGFLIQGLTRVPPLSAESMFFENPFLYDVEQQIYLRVEDQSYAISNIQPVYEMLIDRWGGKYSSHPPLLLGFLERFRGIQYYAWSFGYLERQDWKLEGNRDLADAYYFYKKKLRLPVGKAFHGEGTLKGYQVDGWRGTFEFSFASFKFLLGASLLTGLQVQDIHLIADVRVDAEDAFRIDADLVQHYHDNEVYEQLRDQTYRGEGQSFDAFVSYRPSTQFHLDLGMKDLEGVMLWNNLLYGVVHGTNESVRVNGKFKALVSGFEITQAYQHRLTTKSMLSAAYQFTDNSHHQWETAMTLDHYLKTLYSSTDLTYLNGKLRYSLTRNWTLKTIGFGISHPCCLLRMESDNPDPRNAYALALSLGLRLYF
ncbi:hypothetical protein WDW89_17025 [Deltaproteobacteria bacterium TL4]